MAEDWNYLLEYILRFSMQVKINIAFQSAEVFFMSMTLIITKSVLKIIENIFPGKKR